MRDTSHSLLNYFRVMVESWRDDPRDDATLLARFAENGEETAFRVLVGRHGPLVWRTCQRILGDTPDAEDAFQTTFLTLARKAGKLRREPLAGWLHRVARQVALNADAGARRRRSLQHRLGAVKQRQEEAGEANRAELYAALDEELMGLPERLRVPLLLHYLEGRSQVEVARLLGCARRALQKRLTQGEAILRERLERRGLTVGIGTAIALLTSSVTASAVPACLIGSTARAAVAFRSGTLTGRAAEAARAVLGTSPSCLETVLLRKSLWIMLACVCSLGVGLAAWQGSSTCFEVVDSPEATTSPQTAAEPSGERVDRFGDPLPRSALARLGTLRLRHGGRAFAGFPQGVSGVFSRDGKVLLTAGCANPIRLWDAATGKLLRSFGDRFEHPVRFLVLSPDGRTLATLEHLRTVSLWEVATGKLLHQPIAEGYTYTLSFSRDGRTLLSASSNNHICYIRVWETATGKVLRDLPLRNAEKVGCPSSAFFSPDGKTLASIHEVHDNKIVCFWEAATGKELRRLPLSEGMIPPGGIALSPDGRFLAVSSFKDSIKSDDNWSVGAIHLWEVATGKEVWKWTPDKTRTYSLAFSPDGKVLATGSGFGPIRLWEAATGKELRQCQGYRAHVAALAFSPDGSTLASLAGLHDHTARLWEVASGKELFPISGGHVGPIVSVAFSADGKGLISGGRDGLIGFWNAEMGQEQRPPLRAGDFQALAVLAPDGKTFLTVGNIFSPNVQPNLQPVALESPSLVCVWDRATGQKSREFQGPVGAPQSLALSPDGKILVLSSLFNTYLIEVATGKTMRWFNHAKCPALSPDGKTLAVCIYEEGRLLIHFYAIATGKDLGDVKTHGEVWCLAFSPDGQTLAVGGVDNLSKDGKRHTICLWRARVDKKGWKEAGTLVGHQAEVWGLAFSPDGKTLASASADGTLRLWELATGKERRRFVGHSGAVWCLAFAPDGRRLAAGGDDTTTLVWDVTGRLRNGQLPAVKPSAQEVQGLWADLAGADAVRAGQAVWTLASAPSQILPFLRENLRPAISTGPRIVRLIADLDNDDFAVRQRATEELAKLGEVAEPALRLALAKPDSLEMRRRLEQLLEPLEKGRFLLSGQELRSLRALEVLGQLGTPESLRLLEVLAGGAPEARLTLEAQTILKRLGTRGKVAKP